MRERARSRTKARSKEVPAHEGTQVRRHAEASRGQQCLEEWCGTPAVGEQAGDFVAEREVAAEEEAARERLLVREGSHARHGRALAEAAHDDAVGGHARLHLVGNEAVDQVPGRHRPLLVLGRLQRQAQDVGPRGHPHAAV